MALYGTFSLIFLDPDLTHLIISSDVIFLHMKRNRSRNDIVASILRLVKEKGRLGITNIMYGSYLSYQQVARYLQLLIEGGLLDYDERNGLYRITEKGLQFLELYDKMDELLKEGRPRLTNSLALLFCYVLYPLFPVLGELI